MALTFEMGWDIAHYGSLSMSITESGGGGATTVTMSSGQYCHSSITTDYGGTAIPNASTYGSFATGLKAALEAVSPNTLTYTVTYSTSNKQYTLSPSAGTVALTFSSADSNVRMRRLLGFSASQSTAASHTSDQTPWGVISGAQGAKSSITDDYEVGVVEEARAGVYVYQVAEDSMAHGHDFTVPLEPKTATYKYPHGAASAETFTWQHLFEQLRPGQPFLVRDGSENAVHQMMADAALFKPIRNVADYDDYWDIRFQTYVLGRL